MHGRLRPAAVVGFAVAGLIASGAAPARGAGRSGGPLGTARAAAFALDVDVDVLGAVPLDVGPVARLRLSGDAGPRFENVAKVEVPPLIEALVLASGAETEAKKILESKASSRVATVKLHLLGDLLIKVLKSECHVTKDRVDLSSDVVFADGSVLGIAVDMVGLQARPNSRVDIPGVGSLILNEQRIEKRTTGKNGRLSVTVNALRLELDGILGTGDVTVAQSVCKLRGPGVGHNLTVGSTTNGNDTSGDIDDEDGDGVLGGVEDGVLDLGGLLGDDAGGLLGVNSLLGVNRLLGGGLLGGGLGGLL